jgi:hypothetical protein
MIKHFTFLLFFSAFGLLAFAQTRTTITLTDKEVTVTSYTDNVIVVGGQTDLHIIASSSPLTNSIVKLNSENSWVFFDNIRPSVVISSLLPYINVNNQAAVLNTNLRVAIYKQGTVVIPQPGTYQPLQVFTGTNYTGNSQKYALFTFYNDLGTYDNNIRSFKLKRGYMATMATNADGTGYSRVFIADKEDLNLPAIPVLGGTASFIRVVKWEWVSKKGWCGTGSGSISDANKVNGTWFYSWSADQASQTTLEYVPIRQKDGWPSWTEINGKQYVSHVLGYNEPDHTEQSNVTVARAVAEWPNMLKTGLRVGAPAVTNNSWLYQFMDSCDAHHYRVDYVAYHAYWGAKSAINWYNDLKAIYVRTGRPLWITEWNNGANWTTETWPDASKALTTANAQKQLTDITNILQVLDTASFIERYSIYNWVQDCRAMILADTLTPAGKYYAANNSKLAFNRATEVVPSKSFSDPVLSIQFGSGSKASLSSSDLNGEYNQGYILEKKIDDGEFVKIQDSTGTSVKYSELIGSNVRKVRFRIRTLLPGDLQSGNSNVVGYDITEGKTIQSGKITTSNTGWNDVFFKQAYSDVPVIILGAPTNNNTAIYLSSRAKQDNGNSFTFQLAPWAYQGVTILPYEESMPYFILNPGTYNFGDLNAIAGKVSANPTWTQVTFSQSFDVIPVVFVSQLTSSVATPTAVRIRNVSKTGFEVKIQKESKANATLVPETVSYLAITQGKGVIDGRKVVVGKTSDAPVSVSAFTSITYGDTIANPIFIGQMQTCNDDTVTATLRCQSIYSSYARVFKQREKSYGFTAAANEDAGWMVVTPESATVGKKTMKATSFKIAPNPVADYLYFDKAFTTKGRINIYTTQGSLVKSAEISGNNIDVRELPAGYYLLRTSANETTKFVKR